MMIKQRIHYINALFLSLGLMACNDAPVAKQANNTENMAQNLAAPKVPDSNPEDFVRDFYQAVADNNCTLAMLIRPSYSQAKCTAITSSNINSIRTELNEKGNAVIYLNLDYSKKNKPKQFSGYLRLQKIAKKWEIQEDFASVEDMGIEEFITTYVTEVSPSDNLLSPTRDVIDNNHKQLLSELKQRFKQQAQEKIILVDISAQRMSFYDKASKLIGSYPISAATKGFGNRAGSDKTPLGAHKVSEKFGDGAPLGSIFVGRQNTGRIAKILTDAIDVKEDYVTTRVLWLEGLEPGKNKGGNVDSHSRYIYIHGTPEEGLIGKPASHGCIRMINKDVVNVFRQSPENTLVYIGE